MWGGLFLMVCLLTAFDPDNHFIQEYNLTWLGNFSLAITTIVSTLKDFVPLILLYFARKMFHDYPEADVQTLGRKALETPLSAAIFAVALALFTLAYALLIKA
jgi:hypothetical protein